MSQTLKQAREEFLGSCQFTAQAPGSYYWCGEYADMYGQLAVVHAIPLYSYVGVELGDFKSFEFEFRDITRTKTVAPQKMTVEDVEPTDRDYVKDRLRPYLEFWRSKGKYDHFKVKLWSEIPSQCGLNSSGAAAAALSALLHVLEATPKERNALIRELNGWQDKTLAELNKDDTFNAVFRRAWILDSCAHNFVGSGTGPFSSLVGCPDGGLLLYWTEMDSHARPRRIVDLGKSSADLKPDDFAHIEEETSKIKWRGGRLPLKEDLQERLGLALVYPGLSTDTGRTVQKLDALYKTSADDLKACFSRLFPNCGPATKLARPMSDFMREHDRSSLGGDSYPRHVFSQSLGLLSWMLVRIIEHGNRDELLSHVRTVARFIDFYDAPLKELLKVRETLEATTDIAVKAAGPGSGDLVLFGEADQMQNIEIRLGERYSVHFSTNRMGWRAKGLVLQKSLAKMPGTGTPRRNSLQLGLRKGVPWVTINGRATKERITEPVFASLVLLAAARKTGREIAKVADLLLPSGAGEKKEQHLTNIRDILGDARSTRKSGRKNWLPSDGKGNVRLQIFTPASIVIDRSICQFESRHMTRAERYVEEILKNAKMRREGERRPPQEVALLSRLEYEARLAFRHTTLIMRALKMMGRKYRDESWRERWDNLVSRCHAIFQQCGYDEDSMRKQLYLPQRGLQ